SGAAGRRVQMPVVGECGTPRPASRSEMFRIDPPPPGQLDRDAQRRAGATCTKTSVPALASGQPTLWLTAALDPGRRLTRPRATTGTPVTSDPATPRPLPRNHSS